MTPVIDSATALIVVDMQNGFLERDTAMARMGFETLPLRAAIAPCRELLAMVRGTDALIVHTRYVYAADYSDGGFMVDLLPGLREEGALRAGDWEVEIVPELAPVEGEVVIDKNRPSAFWGTPLDMILADRGIRRVLVAGVTTNCCVESTVRDACHRDLETWLVTDATAEMDAARHDHAIRAMTLLFARGTTVAALGAALH